jgi:hypothetical protein
VPAKARLRDLHRTLDPVALLAEMHAVQTELGERVDRRPGKMLMRPPTPSPAADAAVFAKTLGGSIKAGEPRGTHRQAACAGIDGSACDCRSREEYSMRAVSLYLGVPAALAMMAVSTGRNWLLPIELRPHGAGG